MKDEKLNNSGAKLTNQLINRLTNLLFYLSILFFVIGFNFTDVMVGNWYQQFFPNLHGARIVDITFTDSLTGYAITGLDTSGIAYILKTTNSGDNWFASLTYTKNPARLGFINSNTGFIARGFVNGYDMIYKTTNGGANWLTLNMPELGIANDISVLDENTMWVADPAPLNIGGIYHTSNGGQSWTRLYAGNNNNPEHIYMFNARIGFMTLSQGGGGNYTKPRTAAQTGL